MKNYSMLVMALALCGLASQPARAEITAPVLQLPKIACTKPIAELQARYNHDLKERLSIANHFLSDQVNALKKLKKNLAGDAPILHALLAPGIAGAPNVKATALQSVYQYERTKFAKAEADFDDESWSSNPWTSTKNWTEKMDFGAESYPGSYSVTACSQTYSDGKYERDLKMCSILDTESGMIWGASLKEALQLGGSFVDENVYMFRKLKSDYPMCLEAAGFTAPSTATTAGEPQESKSVAASASAPGSPSMAQAGKPIE